MNYYWYFCLFVLGLSGIIIPLFLKLTTNKRGLLQKILAIIYGLLFLTRFFLYDELPVKMIGLDSSPFGPTLTIALLLLIAMTYGTVILLSLQPFFKIKIMEKLLKIVVPISIILNLIFFKSYITFLMGSSYLELDKLPIILFMAEMALGLIMLVPYYFNGFIKLNKSEIKPFILIGLGLMICTLPSYTWQVLFGLAFPNLGLVKLYPTHRILIYLSFIIPMVIYFIFREKEYKVKKYVLLLIALGTMITFCSYRFKISNLDSPIGLPLHLCNAAMFIIPFCLITNSKKVFYFTYFINVLGAFIAILMPVDGVTIFQIGYVSYWINHWCAFFMPLLMVALGIFPKPKLKSFTYSMIAFIGYFLIMAFINAWFSNYGTVNYFYMQGTYIPDKFGDFGRDVYEPIISFNLGQLKLTFHWLYLILFYLVYVVVAVLMWFLYANLFVLADYHKEMHYRYKKIKLDALPIASQSIFSKRKTVDMEKVITPSLEINHFSKKYGNSKNFAVKDASFSVKSGEIIGFLGPNGAGKSTIIKSIVGMQTITEGNISVCGFDAQKDAINAKKQIGFVPDHYALYEKLTGREYINYIADIYEVGATERNERIDYYLRVLNLVDAFDQKMETYSHGMKQKIAIISALIHEPKVWILDEPLTGLDPDSIYQVKECMRNHAAKGNIVFFSSHIIDVVEKICTRIIVIKDGEIIATGHVDEIESKGQSLEHFFLNAIGSERIND